MAMAATHCFLPPAGTAAAAISSSLLFRSFPFLSSLPNTGSPLSPRIPTTSPPFHQRNPKRGPLRHLFPLPPSHDASTAIKPLRSQGAGGAADPEGALSRFWRWLGEKGVDAQAVRPAAVPEGLGLLARRDIARNEVVLEVPKRIWINPDTAAADPELGRFCAGLKPWVSVTLFLLREKARGGQSPWKPYLDILPTATNSPLFWSEQELSELLQGSQLLSTILGVKEFLKSEFLKVEEDIILPNKHLFPSPVILEDFVWAFGILRSRAFSRLKGENLILVPLADLINHNPNITSEDSAWEIKGKGLFSREQMFSLRAAAPVKAGEQGCSTAESSVLK